MQLRHKQQQQRMPLAPAFLLLALASLACGVLGQLPPLQPFPPLQPLQPFQPMQPFPPLQPLPGMAPFPAMAPFGAQAAGRAGGFGGYGAATSASSSSFGGPRPSSTPGCTIVHETSEGSQGYSSNVGGSSCSTSQKIEVCNGATPGSWGHTRAVATVNGQQATCCVVLLKLPAKTPQMFCASPRRGTSYARLPAAHTIVQLKPSCVSSLPGTTAGSLACTVTFAKLPPGYTYPEGNKQTNPLVMNRSSKTASTPEGFQPCNSSKFTTFQQVVSRTSASGVVLTSKCE